jgi:hypothetical protein
MPVKIPPPSPAGEPATSEDFFEAIHHGDSEGAADALRRMDGLGPSDVQLLADLLSGDPVHANLFPFVLTLRRRRGRPMKDLIKKKRDQARIARAVQRVHEKSGSLKLAVATIIKEERAKKGEKWSRSKILEACRAVKDIEGRPSTPMTKEEQELALAMDSGELEMTAFVQGGQMIESGVPAAAALGLQSVDEIEHAAKPPTSVEPDGASGAGEMAAGPADQHAVALPNDEPTGI